MMRRIVNLLTVLFILAGFTDGHSRDSWSLILGPADRGSGFRPTLEDATPWGDAWGASVLRGDDGLYHMWVSVMANNASMEYWPVNSYVIHATSTNAEGPYEYVADAFPVFAHEADVKRGPGGKWIAFLTAGVVDGQLGPSSYGPAIEFSEDGQPTRDISLGASNEATVLVTADSPYGPWSDPIVLLEPAALLDGIDANLSAVVHDDGSLVGLWRTWPEGSQVHWVRAANYLDPETYEWQEQETPLFQPPYDGHTPDGLEDMFVWYDQEDRVYHALFHDMVVPEGSRFHDALGHAYSTDGTNWVYTGEVYTGEATSTIVRYTDGTTTRSSRARPHLLIVDGKITHLISAEQEPEDGRNFTLIEPVLDFGFGGDSEHYSPADAD
jgi:hypothetical protein